MIASNEAEVVMQQVKVSADAAEIVKAKVAEVKSKAEELVAQIKEDTVIAEGKLELAKPALDEAEAALNVFFTFSVHFPTG